MKTLYAPMTSCWSSSTCRNGSSIEARLILFVYLPARDLWMPRPSLKQSVTIALADTRLNSKLRSVRSLKVRGEGATLSVPLDSSSAAFERLETCFNRREASEANPFVGRNASEANPFVPPSRKR